MGLIKALKTATASTFADEWKEYIYADSIKSDTLVVRGRKKVGPKSANVKGNENVISKDSVIAVSDGQAMAIVEDGKVIEYSDEAGSFVFDSSAESSIFSKDSSIMDTFKKIGGRFKMGGDAGRDQRVYYFNLKEISSCKFGTAEPIMYDDPVYQFVSVRFFGNAVLKLVDPIKFYTNVSGNVTGEYKIDTYWENTLKIEFVSKLSTAMARLAIDGIKFSQIPQSQDILAKYMNECLDEEWLEKRGIVIDSLGIGNISLDPKDKEKVNKIDEMRLLTDPTNAAGRMASATANAMETAAGNASGAMHGFMGMNMVNSSGATAGLAGLYQQGMANQNATQNNNPSSTTTSTNGWTCECGEENSGNFCNNCGSKKVVKDTWACSCGADNTGKFCGECGSKKEENGLWKCSCGAENEGKFCGECGSPKE